MNQYFPPRPDISPKIYAYQDTNPQYNGLLKIGYTATNVAKRVGQQYPTLRPGALPYKIVLETSAMKNDGGAFMDHEVHRYLRKKGFLNPEGEWFRCGVPDIEAAILAIQTGERNEDNRTQNFGLRPEQQEAIDKAVAYFESYKAENNQTPHFLWNAKMRFGKTFSTYKLAQKMGWTKILILTFKPAVQNAWEEDLQNHIDFKGWQFVARDGLHYQEADKSKPIVCFASFQDFLGRNSAGGIKVQNEWAHTINWDCIALDEYHYGAWRENAKELMNAEEGKEQKYAEGEGIEYFDESIMPLTTNAYLYLSGTPFRAISSGEFIEEQIYNWTYLDEQKAKLEW